LIVAGELFLQPQTEKEASMLLKLKIFCGSSSLHPTRTADCTSSVEPWSGDDFHCVPYVTQLNNLII